MAVTITQRTLAGYSKASANIVYIKGPVQKLRGQDKYTGYKFREELADEFGTEGIKVKFTAVVGNPPYQINTGTNFATPVYHLFFEAAKSLSLITLRSFIQHGSYSMQGPHLKIGTSSTERSTYVRTSL